MQWHRMLAFIVVLTFSLCMLAPGQAGDPKKDDSYVKVEARGKLQTGIMAPGGETTGTILRTDTVTLELDLGKDKDLAAQVDKLKNQTVLVTGTLQVRKGVAVKTRWIVQVATLKAAEMQVEKK